MYLQYNKKIVDEKFIGYFLPNGELLDFSHKFGLGGHYINSITQMFRYYFKIKYTVSEENNIYY